MAMKIGRKINSLEGGGKLQGRLRGRLREAGFEAGLEGLETMQIAVKIEMSV